MASAAEKASASGQYELRTVPYMPRDSKPRMSALDLAQLQGSYATTLDEAGFSLKQIMDLLGHSDIATTLRYLGSRSLKSHQLAMEKVRW